MLTSRTLPSLLLLCVSLTGPLLAATPEQTQALQTLRAVGPKGVGHAPAMAAWKIVAAMPASELPAVLAAFDGATPLAENWLRGAVETIAQRQTNGGAKLPVTALEAFLNDTQHAPRGRRLAYELIAAVDNDAKQRLIPPLLNDPSLELRRDAVAMKIDVAEKAIDNSDAELAIKTYRQAFNASRDLDQVKLTADKLKSLDEKVDLPAHFGFVMNWRLLGPFDNKETKGFDVAYPPETVGYNANATYDGVNGEIKWLEHSTVDDYGVVDLAKALDKHKGAIVYCFAKFDSEAAREVQLRLGSPNANKLWVNGELVFANNVYHAGNNVDQYIGTAKLKQGTNTILLKIAQNEQKEPWAQDWSFQLRICDVVGTAVLAPGRAANKTAAK
ncbi:MAG TPA: hypothetical protein VL096_11420 [Pirellulaceae bacterium]|nr:hypothetical protein [Pirellulaceae bacterium]